MPIDRIDKLLLGSLSGVFAGLYLTIRIKNNPAAIARASGFGLAGKALAIGTIISVSSVGLGIGMLAKILNVTTIMEFGDKMRDVMKGWGSSSPSSSSTFSNEQAVNDKMVEEYLTNKFNH